MRWLKFNAVGAMGAALQFALLALFVHVAGMHYLLATAFSVEAVILHNFVWHRRWTWHDRRGTSRPAIAALARFNLTNGLVSLTANLLSAYLLTGVWRIDPVIASLASTAVASLANFFLSDRFVFASLLTRVETSASRRVCKLTHWTPQDHRNRRVAHCYAPAPIGRSARDRRDDCRM